MLESGELEVEDATAVHEILNQVSDTDWVLYIQPPPKDISNPADVVKYLARYMTGGPISDKRLLEVKDDRVFFLARSRDKSRRRVRESLPVVEFIRQWTLHRSGPAKRLSRAPKLSVRLQPDSLLYVIRLNVP